MASVYIKLPLLTSSVTGTIATSEVAQVPTYNYSLTVANTGITTIAKPANARWAKVWAEDVNASKLRVTMDGSTNPTSLIGFQFEPGRSEDFIAVGDLKVIAESATTTDKIHVQWGV